MPETKPVDRIPVPALLRAARGAYSHAIQARLAGAGFEDLPRGGPFVLGGLVNQGEDALDLAREASASPERAGQLVDALVMRGYLASAANPVDTRRRDFTATERGQAAAVAVRDGVLATDAALAARISPEQLSGLRAGLVALCDIREELEDEARGHRS